MKSRPFGFDPSGQPYAQVSGKLIRAAVEALETAVSERVRSESGDVQKVVNARREAVARLVSRLNDAIGDPAYHVTAESLMVEGNRYSREFELFVNVFCLEISEDPTFYWRRGSVAIPGSVATLFRPLSIRHVFELLPRAVTRFVNADVSVSDLTDTSAVVRWNSERQQDGLPPELRSEWLEMGCPAFCGALSSIPRKLHPHLPPASVETLRCQRQTPGWCEWRFTWRNPVTPPRRALVAGGLASLCLLAVSVSGLPGARALLPLALLPAAWGFHRTRRASLEEELQRKAHVSVEVRELAERLITERDDASSDAQLLRLTSERAIATVNALGKVSAVLRGRLDRESLLRTSTAALADGRLFDRALVVLLAPDGKTLAGGVAHGSSADVVRRVRDLTEELEPGSALAKASPLAFWPSLATREALAAPALLRGRALGLLVVDNSVSGRPLTPSDEQALMAVASMVSAGLDLIRLRSAGTASEVTWPGTQAPPA
jgi:hypothetical protein